MPLFPYTSVRHRRMNYYWHMTQRAKCPGEWKETFLCHPARPGMRSRTIVGATLGSPCDRALPPCTHRLAKPCHSRGDALCSPSTPRARPRPPVLALDPRARPRPLFLAPVPLFSPPPPCPPPPPPVLALDPLFSPSDPYARPRPPVLALRPSFLALDPPMLAL